MHTGHKVISFTSGKSCKFLWSELSFLRFGYWGLMQTSINDARYLWYLFVKNIRNKNFLCSSRSGHNHCQMWSREASTLPQRAIQTLIESCMESFKQKQPPQVFCKKRCFLKILRIHKKTPAPGLFFIIKFRPATLLKKRLWHRRFPMNFCEIFLKNFFL